MDGVLLTFYSWCLEHGVPIMAHTSPTNGPSDVFQNLTLVNWGNVRDAFPGIRINFAHFGFTDLAHDGQETYLSGLMNPNSGQYLYADSAYFAELLSRPSELMTFLASLMKVSKKKGDAALAQRLMYGTDWEGPTSEKYLQRFEAVFSALDNQSLGAQGRLSDRFFGVNAAIFLGLGTGQPNRQRLDQYYGSGPKPAWMAKVDKVTAAAA